MSATLYVAISRTPDRSLCQDSPRFPADSVIAETCDDFTRTLAMLTSADAATLLLDDSVLTVMPAILGFFHDDNDGIVRINSSTEWEIVEPE